MKEYGEEFGLGILERVLKSALKPDCLGLMLDPPFTSYLTSLCLGFLIREMEIIVVLTS